MKEANTSVTRAQKEIKLTPKQECNFWKKVDKNGPTMPNMDTPCWIWIAYKTKHGYGMFSCCNGKMITSHRVSWVISNGQIDNDDSYHGTCVCHQCDNPACCNPKHLFLGTQGDNARDRENKNRGNHAKGDSNGSRKYPERLMRGDSHSSAKLSSTQVIEIRARYEAGGVFHRELAAEFGVSRSLITNITERRCWKHI
jgi:hypothetical protein